MDTITIVVNESKKRVEAKAKRLRIKIVEWTKISSKDGITYYDAIKVENPMPEHQFIGIIDWSEGIRIVKSYRDNLDTDKHECDHCHTKRQRNKIFIVEDKNGKLLYIGSSCVKEYLKVDPAVLEYIGNFPEPGDGEKEDYGKKSGFNLESFLAVAIDTIEKHGFAAAQAVETVPTAVRVLYAIKNGEYHCLSEEIKARARAMIDFIKTVEPQGKTYIFNILEMIENNYVPISGINTAASIPVFYKRITETMESGGEWVGKIGEKIEIEVEFIKKYYKDTLYGMMKIMTFKDKNGNIFVWFTNSSASNYFEEDKTYTLTGTIKSHDLYGKMKQTILTRVKIKK
jgi:hypothetical protein